MRERALQAHGARVIGAPHLAVARAVLVAQIVGNLALIRSVLVIPKRAFRRGGGARIMPNLQRTMALIARETCADWNNDMDRTRG
jgi:hypothetical protein